MDGRNVMTKPDFKTWAENIVLLAQAHGTAREEVEKALEQAYNQGYSLGLNNGWAIEQDKQYCDKCDRSHTPDSKGWQTI